jgi:hypothetical protein
LAAPRPPLSACVSASFARSEIIMNRTRLAAATAAVAGLAISAHAQSVVNGGFESGSLSGWTLDGDQTYIGVISGNFDGLNPHGGSYLSYQGPVGGTAGFHQVVTGLHAGDHVTLDFWYASDGNTPNAFSCVFDNQTLVSLTNDTTHTGWTEFNYAVTISADNPTLAFLFQNDPGYDMLDDVSVSPFNGGTGACCTPLNGCTITSQASCAVQNGSYSGDNSTCAQVNCPTGACCHSNFTCSVGSPGACTSAGGTYAGDGSTCATANCPGPTAGPDVIVGDVYDISRDGAAGNITAYSIGTDSCNLGDVGVTWVSGTNQHPVISGTMYRLKTVSGAAHFEQLGMSWYKHGFLATNQSFCGACSTAAGAQLGPHGCSDIYDSGLNGDQGNMGARSELNATTGVFPYPSIIVGAGGAIGQRCQCFTADVDPAQNTGALYFADATYKVPDDAQFSHNGANATNGLNNVTYRQINASTLLGSPVFSAASHQQMPGIQAWKDQDPTVTLVNADYLDNSVGPNIVARFIAAAKATSLGGGQYHYEYAIYNLNADRSGGSFSVPIPAGAVITNVGFHAPFYHSGEVYDNTAWDSSVTSNAVTWTPHPFSPAANANALRWGSLYNFRFDANIAPGTGAATLGLFKVGSPSSLSIGGLPVPGTASICYANCDGSTGVPFLNVQDFTCFLQKFSLANPYANCDNSTTPPTLNVQDFTCFLQKFALGCSAP